VTHLLDLQGKEVDLGRCLGKGGEGAVYSVPSRPRLVAKIYARTPDDHMSRKLGAMVQLGTETLASLAAWPQDILADERTGHVVGFLMPRVEGHREIHTLYGPIDRKNAFPDASWAFLVRAARNVAAAFDIVHGHGHVIGDVNQGNVVVSRKATVQLIDCDSFQIAHLGRTYPCRVGVPLFTPPELQGQKLEEVIRTPDHDRFGLAVLIFHLLFMGRHPFAGRHPEHAIPVTTAIREGSFAYGFEAALQEWEPPPFSLRITDVPSSVAQLFEQAFEGHATATRSRPPAAEWVAALGRLEAMATTCGENPRHVYVSGPCPWCRIEKDGGPSFFQPRPGAEVRRSMPEVPLEVAMSWGSITENEAIARYLSDEERQDAETLRAVRRLYRLNTSERIATALRGTWEERALLVRDPNRLVAAAVLGSGRLTDPQVEAIAAMKNVSECVLRQIGTHQEWTRNYPVVVNLVRNPRTPIGISMKLLSRLNPRDMKALAKDGNVTDAVRKAAQRFLKPPDGGAAAREPLERLG